MSDRKPRVRHYVPTEEMREVVIEMANNGCYLQEIAEKLDITVKTLRKFYPTEVKLIKNQRGRPAHIPTEKTKAIVENMSINGASNASIARKINISENTLVLHYKEQLEFGVDNLCQEAVTELRKLILRGNLGAICFALKCKGKWREKSALEELEESSGSLNLIWGKKSSDELLNEIKEKDIDN